MDQTAKSLADGDTATRGKKKKSLSIGITGAIVALITIIECAAIYNYLGRELPLPKAEAHRSFVADENIQPRDIDLGKFSLIASDSKSNGSLLIEFHLVGTVVADYLEKLANAGIEPDGFAEPGNKSNNTTENGNTEIEKLFRREKSRFRDQVIVVIDNAQLSALSEPDFNVIEGQILARANSLLGGPLLKEIRFSDFAVVQQ